MADSNQERIELERAEAQMTPEELELERLYGRRGIPSEGEWPIKREVTLYNPNSGGIYDHVAGVARCADADDDDDDDDLDDELPFDLAPKSQLPATVVDMLGRPLKKDGTVSPTVKHPVILMRDHMLDYPELYLEVFLTGPLGDQAGFPAMLARSGCSKALSIEKSDLVIFTGGPDVNPALYNEEPHPKTYVDDARDDEDMAIYLQCLDAGIPMLGICRGAQFLHVMNGGKLYQHVDHHTGDHPITDVKTGEIIEKVSSVHHQMVIENKAGGMEIIATNAKADNHWRNAKDNDKVRQADVEAFFYPDTCCMGIQGHPEYYGYGRFTKWSLEFVEAAVVMNPDIIWEGANRRIKRDLLAMRNKTTNLAAKALVAPKKKGKK